MRQRRMVAALVMAGLVWGSLPVQATLAGSVVPPPGDGCSVGTGSNNGAGCIPAAPLPVALPVAGLAVLGGYAIVVRRRANPDASQT